MASTITARMRYPGSDPQLGRCLDDFVAALRDLWGERLVAVMLYGSVVFDDLAPGYGDLDFLCVCEDNLDDAAIAALIALRTSLRRGLVADRRAAAMVAPRGLPQLQERGGDLGLRPCERRLARAVAPSQRNPPAPRSGASV